jgi:hypothetical protein
MKLSVKTFQLKVESNVEVSTAIISDTLYGASNSKRAAKMGDQRFGAPIEVYEDESLPDFTAQFGETTFVTVEVGRIVHKRYADQLPVELIRLPVIQTLK